MGKGNCNTETKGGPLMEFYIWMKLQGVCPKSETDLEYWFIRYDLSACKTIYLN